ncbi:MAG: thiolase domain-containing protein [Anaerolineales bacterium]|nr:MAG: thiolase domain-containing protein [Anaerolineales bacterium]
MTETDNTKDSIYIIGTGMTPAGEHWERSLRELALEAITLARAEAGEIQPQAIYVANMLAPALSRQSHLGPLVADFSGLRGIEAVAVDAAGASGGMAIRQAYLALSSGQVQIAIVVGVEKVTERVTSEVEAALQTASDADYEGVHGVTQTALAALLMRRYTHEFALPEHALAGFSINAHANAVGNPMAMFRRAIKAETYAQAAMISDPLNVFDAAPFADGAAAIVLARGDVLADTHPFPRVLISASAASTSSLSIHDRSDPLTLDAAVISVQRALMQAKIELSDLDFFELHDSFSIYAALALEAAGFAERGKAWELASNGSISLDGTIPVCTFGGSKARGEVGGATGIYQAVEAVRQLQTRAEANQVKGAQQGMIQVIGGSAATVVTHILKLADTH